MDRSFKTSLRLYKAWQDIGNLEPYTITSAEEFSMMIWHFILYAQLLAMHPNLAAKFSDDSTAHMQLATDLRAALKVSRQKHRYPNVALPVSKYFAAKLLLIKSRSLEQEYAKMVEQENQRWAVEYL